MTHLSLVKRTSDLWGETAFVGEEDAGTGEIVPKVSVSKEPDLKTKTG